MCLPSPTTTTTSGMSISSAGWSPNLEIDMKEVSLDIQLGQGGFGEVWRGLWRGTPVAVKLLSANSSSSSLQQQQKQDGGCGGDAMALVNKGALREFQAEVSMLASLRHPNICLFLGACLKVREGMMTFTIFRNRWSPSHRPYHSHPHPATKTSYCD